MKNAAPDDARWVVEAVFVGGRFDLQRLTQWEALSKNPWTVSVGNSGYAVVFRYGVVVMFNLKPEERSIFLTSVEHSIFDRFAKPETEQERLICDPESSEKVEPSGIRIREFSVERLQVVASVLAKSVVLAHYENAVARAFDQIEPLASSLQSTGSFTVHGKRLLNYLGTALQTQHKMIGRVEVGENPDLLWDNPQLEPLYLRLADEYDLRERHAALESKLELISRTAQTAIELLGAKRSLRVEWYIVVLILVEILLSCYDLFA